VARIHYSRWDGTQGLNDLDADQLLSAMSDDLLAGADLRSALRRLFQRGAHPPQGQRLQGLQDLIRRLQRQRQQRLDRYDLGSALADIEKKLDEIIQKERAGIPERLPEGAERDLRLESLDRLPPDAAGRIKGLQAHPFADPEAERLFQELLRSLQEQMLQPFLKGMKQGLEGLTPEDLARTREMLRDLNRMLRQRMDGEEPDFDAFKQKWGQHFPGAESLDDVLEQIARQSARMQSLMESMSPGQRAQLEEMMRSLFMQDERLEAELRQLAMNLGALLPMDELSRRWDFRGEENVTLKEAMGLMEELSEMERLERQLRQAQAPGDLQHVDPKQVERLLGEEAARDLQQLRDLARKLEEAGYLERHGDRLTLTARAIRKIGETALREVFAHLQRDRFGRHALDRRGAGGDRTDDSKPYEFGDPFLLDLEETVMRAVERGGPGPPVRLEPGDFQVFRTEASTRAATVVMLDMSRSMLNSGCFLPAKKVALALSALIRAQFPRDRLHVVGFSLYAREFKFEELPGLAWSEWSIGTNMHHGLEVARQLLGRDRGANKQILMITDGEPTAHMEDGEAQFSYPPTRRTLQETLKEVQRCTREGIIINTFMLDESRMLAAFVEQMARINRGRAFFVTPDRLGEFVLVDYVRGKRTRSSR